MQLLGQQQDIVAGLVHERRDRVLTPAVAEPGDPVGPDIAGRALQRMGCSPEGRHVAVASGPAQVGNGPVGTDEEVAEEFGGEVGPAEFHQDSDSGVIHDSDSRRRVPCSNRRRGVCRPAPPVLCQDGPKTRPVHRLGDAVRHAGGRTVAGRRLGRIGGEGHQRDAVTGAANREGVETRRLQTAHHRHVDVEERDVEIALLEGLEGFRAVVDHMDTMPFGDQHLADDLLVDEVVLCHEHGQTVVADRNRCGDAIVAFRQGDATGPRPGVRAGAAVQCRREQRQNLGTERRRVRPHQHQGRDAGRKGLGQGSSHGLPAGHGLVDHHQTVARLRRERGCLVDRRGALDRVTEVGQPGGQRPVARENNKGHFIGRGDAALLGLQRQLEPEGAAQARGADEAQASVLHLD